MFHLALHSGQGLLAPEHLTYEFGHGGCRAMTSARCDVWLSRDLENSVHARTTRNWHFVLACVSSAPRRPLGTPECRRCRTVPSRLSRAVASVNHPADSNIGPCSSRFPIMTEQWLPLWDCQAHGESCPTRMFACCKTALFSAMLCIGM